MGTENPAAMPAITPQGVHLSASRKVTDINIYDQHRQPTDLEAFVLSSDHIGASGIT